MRACFELIPLVCAASVQTVQELLGNKSETREAQRLRVGRRRLHHGGGRCAGPVADVDLGSVRERKGAEGAAASAFFVIVGMLERCDEE